MNRYGEGVVYCCYVTLWSGFFWLFRYGLSVYSEEDLLNIVVVVDEAAKCCLHKRTLTATLTREAISIFAFQFELLRLNYLLFSLGSFLGIHNNSLFCACLLKGLLTYIDRGYSKCTYTNGFQYCHNLTNYVLFWIPIAVSEKDQCDQIWLAKEGNILKAFGNFFEGLFCVLSLLWHIFSVVNGQIFKNNLAIRSHFKL